MWRFFRETPQGLDLDRAKEAWRYLCPKKREWWQGCLPVRELINTLQGFY
jgi:hypothetical protein